MKFLNKIKSKLCAEKFLKIFHLKKKTLITLTAVALGFILLYFSFNLYQKNKQEKYSAIFHQALIDEESGNLNEAIAKLDSIYNTRLAPSGVRALASLHYAGILLNNGDITKALTIYEDLAATRRYDNYLRNLSALLAAKLIATNADKNTADADLARIEKLESKSKILRDYVSEQKAIFLLKIEKNEEAYKTAKAITENQEAAPTLKERAADLMKLAVAQGYEVK